MVLAMARVLVLVLVLMLLPQTATRQPRPPLPPGGCRRRPSLGCGVFYACRRRFSSALVLRLLCRR
jgi:hypothetical protein